MSPIRPVVAIHGGAGTPSRAAIDAEQKAAYHAALREILAEAQETLAAGATAVDAVTLAVQRLEDSPLFNAGFGSVFTAAVTHELDAAIMDGATLRAGAVAGVSRIRNPALAARAVMEQGEHVLMAGAGAESFAHDLGMETVEPHYFSTDFRRSQLHRAQGTAAIILDHDGGAPLSEDKKFGTVGAVALDMHGNLAAATSTGGMTNKRPGRVGDTALIGAGTYADNRTAAVSCTGTGEMFIRAAAAHDLCARMAYGGARLDDAARQVVMEALPAIGGRGGLIAIDAKGNVTLPFNTEGMYRGYARVGEPPCTAIFEDPSDPPSP
ncbi:isoaspartyl peptidase/L-asparaginase family protein [Sinorhizobium alkalisoli]|uniref:Isoaspartyl peptidase n=1 Tax=Sinorhizobium alkalisoli TaxID=1752398 RepID=A0A1E3VCP6_9HYPH|nr:isoaspartyl peptidase/L-asparaginase [Sinorhizobium alkalisoli]MCA1493811.1 isoaspartyl peptidase/L-asparaginase [Ensifer sp. NBAIM29]MCG5480802.1 isoaspartyl peptidase/L-asparaginase [Sinorhizobium alkalisoli]ODR91227.1 beta-aspartyl-peptidase [Sinorhizobium alkalisoli]